MKQIKNNKHCIIVSSEFTDWKQLQTSQYDSILLHVACSSTCTCTLSQFPLLL